MKYQDLLISEETLIPIRKELYHSEGPGYYVYRNFLDELFTDHIIDFWSQEVPNSNLGQKVVKGINKGKDLYPGCPNYVQPNPNGTNYYNFFWNHPQDEVTYAVCWKIVELRNEIMKRNFFTRVFPFMDGDRRSVSYRVIITKNGEEIVPSHRDWMGEKYFDPSALQATLILSEYDKDYTGEGMIFHKNDGTQLCLNKDLNLKRGDLVFWRYNNEHSIRNIQTTDEQLGFVRIIFPPEEFFPLGERESLKKISIEQLFREIPRRVRNRIKRNF